MRVVLDRADQDLDADEPEHTEGEPEEPRCRRAARNEVAEHEREADPEDRRSHRMREHGVLKSPEPVVLPRVARVRAGGGRDRAGDEEDEAACGRDDRGEPQLLRHGRRNGSSLRPERAHDQHDRGPEHDRGKQEVRHDQVRVEVEPDGQIAERSLQKRPHEHAHGRPARPARERVHAKGRERGHERRDDHEPADQTVPELDERVDAVLRERPAGFAAWPGLAAEARPGEPDGGAGHDDQPEPGGCGDRERAEDRRRYLEAADTRGGVRDHLQRL